MAAGPFERDLDLVVGLWRGGEDPGLAAGADALAAHIAPAARRERIAFDLPADPEPIGGVRDLTAVSAHLDAADRRMREADAETVLAFGGDCTIAVAPIGHLLARHQELRVVWIDTHADAHTPETSSSGSAYGMPLRAVTGEGHPALVPQGPVLAPQRALLLGARVIDDGEVPFLAASGIGLVAADALDRLGDVLVRLGPEGAPIHIHLDLDVLDADEWPAVEVPTPGGVGIQAVAGLIEDVRSRFETVGITITEHVPDGITPLRRLDPIFAALGLETN
jgi:arginase